MDTSSSCATVTFSGGFTGNMSVPKITTCAMVVSVIAVIRRTFKPLCFSNREAIVSRF